MQQQAAASAAVSSAPLPESGQASGEALKCDQCDFVSKSTRGLKTHTSRAHKVDDAEVLSKRRGSLEMNRRYRSTQSQQRCSWWPCALRSPRGECLAHVYQPCKEQTMQRGSKICRRSPHLYYFSAEILVGDLMFLKCWKFMSSWMFFEMVFFRVCSLIWKCKLPLMHWWTMVTNHSSWLMMRMKICHLSFHSTPNLMRIAFSFWARFRRRDMTGTWLEMLKGWGMRGMNCRVFFSQITFYKNKVHCSIYPSRLHINQIQKIDRQVESTMSENLQCIIPTF